MVLNLIMLNYLQRQWTQWLNVGGSGLCVLQSPSTSSINLCRDWWQPDKHTNHIWRHLQRWHNA